VRLDIDDSSLTHVLLGFDAHGMTTWAVLRSQ
jgi:hypothetical protein